MSQRAVEFVEAWVDENIPPETFVGKEGGDPQVASHANDLLYAAEAEGITRGEIEKSFGDIEAYIARAMDTTAQAEVDRLAARDKF